MAKIVFFAFRGDPLCFIHVLLNALDLDARNQETCIVLEGEAVRLVPEMARQDHFLHQLYTQVRAKKLIVGCCRACSTKLGAAAAIEGEGLPLIGEMSGHPAMADYLEQGYTVLPF